MIIIGFFLFFESSEPLKIGPYSFQSLLSCWVLFFIIFISPVKRCHYTPLQPIHRLLFIVIGILKVEHNYHQNSFFIFQKSRQPSAALQLYSYTPRLLLLLLIAIEILNIEYYYQWDLFIFNFQKSQQPPCPLASWSACRSSF